MQLRVVNKFCNAGVAMVFTVYLNEVSLFRKVSSNQMTPSKFQVATKVCGVS